MDQQEELDFGENPSYGEEGSWEAAPEDEGELEDGEVKEDLGEEFPSPTTTPSPPAAFASKTATPASSQLSRGEIAEGRRLAADPNRRTISPPHISAYDEDGGGGRVESYPPDQWGMQPMENIVCKYFVRAGCAFGAQCKFAHPPGQAGSMPPFPSRRGRGFPPFPGHRNPFPHPIRPRPPPRLNFSPPPPKAPSNPAEESWEAGLRKAKALLRKSGKTVHDTVETQRPKTPPTPDPEAYYGLPPRPELPPAKPPAPPPKPILSSRPSRDQYESYIPPSRGREDSAPLPPRELPPPPRERNHAHPPPKIFKGTSGGGVLPPSRRTPPPTRRSPPHHSQRQTSPSRRHSSSSSSSYRHSQSQRRSSSGRRDREGDRDRERERDRDRDHGRPLPYDLPSSNGKEWRDPWARQPPPRSEKRRRADSSSSASDEEVRRRRRDSVSSTESYDSQKDLSVPVTPGKSKDGPAPVASSQSQSPPPPSTPDKDYLVQQLKAVEDQIAKKRKAS